MRALPAHDLHVIVNKHAFLLLSAFQHGVDTNKRTSSPNAGTANAKQKGHYLNKCSICARMDSFDTPRRSFLIANPRCTINGNTRITRLVSRLRCIYNNDGRIIMRNSSCLTIF